MDHTLLVLEQNPDTAYLWKQISGQRRTIYAGIGGHGSLEDYVSGAMEKKLMMLLSGKLNHNQAAFFTNHADVIPIPDELVVRMRYATDSLQFEDMQTDSVNQSVLDFIMLVSSNPMQLIFDRYKADASMRASMRAAY